MFSPILEDIDKIFPKRPVFVFGYSQLMRGISCASRLPRSLTLHTSSPLSCKRTHALQVPVEEACADALRPAARRRDVDLPPRAGR